MISLLSSCQLCPHRCKVNRLKGEKGFCGAGKDLNPDFVITKSARSAATSQDFATSGVNPAIGGRRQISYKVGVKIYSYHLHHGEEPPISGTAGSGTIFFSHCNSHCVYCQNYKFSRLAEGDVKTIDELTEIMLGLQEKDAHNINLVTPQHFVPHIVEAVKEAKKKGLKIPIVYNTNGYDLPETLELLNGIVDIYLPDMRYADNEKALKYSSLPDYVKHNRKAVKIMHKQVGELVVENGIAKKGLIIRLLVLPNNIAGIRETMKFIAEEVSPHTYISLMSQYYPVFEASKFPEINRQITMEEYREALDAMQEFGLENGWQQENPSEKDRDTFLGINF